MVDEFMFIKLLIEKRWFDDIAFLTSSIIDRLYIVIATFVFRIATLLLTCTRFPTILELGVITQLLDSFQRKADHSHSIEQNSRKGASHFPSKKVL